MFHIPKDFKVKPTNVFRMLVVIFKLYTHERNEEHVKYPTVENR